MPPLCRVYATLAENGIDGLQFAKAWLERAFLKYNADAAETASSQNASATTSSPATPAAILNTAYMELLDWDENQVFPEVGTMVALLVRTVYVCNLFCLLPFVAIINI